MDLLIKYYEGQLTDADQKLTDEVMAENAEEEVKTSKGL
jgi:hypothetical protein